jgi:hypothetical protein
MTYVDANPFKGPDASIEPPVRRASIWSRLMWFALGFIASFVIWSFVNYRMYSARDYTQGIPVEIREGAPDWLKKAKGRRVGLFTIIAADGPNKASAHVFPTQTKRSPQVAFEDVNSDGQVDSLVVTDSKHRTFEFAVADGAFQTYNYAPDLFAIDSVTFFDYDMDGRFDFRVGPGGRYALLVDSQWHDLVSEGGGKGRVEVNGIWVPAEYANGAWQLKK